MRRDHQIAASIAFIIQFAFVVAGAEATASAFGKQKAWIPTIVWNLKETLTSRISQSESTRPLHQNHELRSVSADLETAASTPAPKPNVQQPPAAPRALQCLKVSDWEVRSV